MLKGRKTTTDDIPPRSRLYHLAPLGQESSSVESLTSYINRLAWLYKVSPRLLIAQEIVPHLTGSYRLCSSIRELGSFCRRLSMGINGASEIALDWVDTLTRLTQRPCLQNLTLLSWRCDLSTHGLLRIRPAWCPMCYYEWKEKGFPLYQPFLWMLQMMSICPQHKVRLQESCPSCFKAQSAIAAKTQPGFCTQCNHWLGAAPQICTKRESDDKILVRQQWMMHTIDDIYQTGSMWKTISSHQVQGMIAAYVDSMGGVKQLAQLLSIGVTTLSEWKAGKSTPSLKSFLEFCYRLNVSPLQLITNKPILEKEVIQSRCSSMLKPAALPKPKREHVLACIQAILAGQEPVMGAREIERRFGWTNGSLARHFPEEYVLLSARYRSYRAERNRQRSQQMCDEVREIILSLYAQGICPSHREVRARLSNQNMFRRPEVLTTYHGVRHQLGFE